VIVDGGLVGLVDEKDLNDTSGEPRARNKVAVGTTRFHFIAAEARTTGTERANMFRMGQAAEANIVC
jgi:hypothetical protein